MKTKEEILELIKKRNAEIRKDHERRYGQTLPEEVENARFRRIMDTPDAWVQI